MRSGSKTRVAVLHVTADFPDVVHSGCEALLLPVLHHLDAMGAEVDLYFPYPTREKSGDTRVLSGVTMKPLMKLHAPPRHGQPTAPYEFASLIEAVGQVGKQADVLYLHGNGLHFNGHRFSTVSANRVVASVHDLVYPFSLVGALEASGSCLIAVSEYLGGCMRHFTQRTKPGATNSIRVVPNGYSPVRRDEHDIDQLRDLLGISSDVIPVLYPHRPEPSKGMTEAFRILRRLDELLPARRLREIKLLVPVLERPDLQRAYRSARAAAADMGIADLVHFHPWIPHRLMPAYYALGCATLCVGTYVETFGSVHVESTLAGTPAIVSRVAAQRTVLPDEMVRKVDPGDTYGAARHLAEIIAAGERSDGETRRHILDTYSSAAMGRGYAQAILGDVAPPIVAGGSEQSSLSRDSLVCLPPWCARLESGYYNDFSGYVNDHALERCLPALSNAMTVGELVQQRHTSVTELRRWFAEGLIVFANGESDFDSL